MEPVLRSVQVLKQEAEDIGFEGKEILEYVKEHQKLDREERAAWRNIQMAEDRRADEIHMAELKAEKEKRTDEIQIEVDKELKLKKMEIQAQAQAQANTSPAATHPPSKQRGQVTEATSLYR